MAKADTHAGSPVSIELGELIRLNDAARQLRLRPKLVTARQSGQYLSRLRGRGMEFDESRPYQPGDDVRNIDWRVTARIGRPFSKLFREERERPVLLSVDARAAMFFATRGRFKWVQAARLAALLAWTAQQGGDRVGGEIFQGQSFIELRPYRGKAAVLHFLRVMAAVSAPSVADPDPSLQQPMRRIRRTAHPGSLVVFVSDFRGLDEVAERQLARIARHNDVLLLHVHDWLESRLPQQGVYRLGDGRRVIELDARQRKLQEGYQRRYHSRVKRLQKLCRRLHMSCLQCATDEEPLAVLRGVYGKGLGK